MSPEHELIRRTVAATLSQVCEWDHELGEKYLFDVIERIESDEWIDDYTCPLCEEMTCDDGCPLAPIRLTWTTDQTSD